jgi:ABC-type nitrate/sulfonate/bicarbonate transport system permease component
MTDALTSPIKAEDIRQIEHAFLALQRRIRRRSRISTIMLNILGVAAFLALWEIVPRVGLVGNVILFPPPSVVVQTMWPMTLSGEIPFNILMSVTRAVSGYVLATVLGIAIGVMTARNRTIRGLLEPLLHGFRSIPAIAVVPISVLWFGIGEGTKIILVTIGAFFPIWINTFIGVRDVHQIYLRSAACLGASPLQTLFLVILPASLPLIIAGMRQGLAVSLIVLVAAELAGARAGVAYMMSLGHQLFKTDLMFAGLLILAFLGFAGDRLFVALCRRLFPWYRPST